MNKDRYTDAMGTPAAGPRLRELVRESNPATFWIMLIVPVLLTVWVYFGKQDAFVRFFPVADNRYRDLYSTLYEFGSAFLLMFGIPALFIRLVFRERLRDYGLRAGNWKTGLKWIVFLLPVMVLTAFLAAAGADMQAEYPLVKSAAAVPHFLLAAEAAYLIYYLGWEFCFRGFMLFGLEERLGALPAVLIQMIPSTLVHIGKPFGETIGAVFGGLLFGYLALRTRSIWTPLLLHAVLGISTDLFVLLLSKP